MSRATIWDERTRRQSLVASTLAGVLLGAMVGIMLAGIVVIAGGALVIWDGFFGGANHHFTSIVSAAPACIPLGTIGGGMIAYVRTSRRAHLGERGGGVPARPDAPAP